LVYESTSIGQENLRQVQGHPSQGCGAGDLRELQAQTAAGIKQRWLLVSSYQQAGNLIGFARSWKLAVLGEGIMARIAGVDLPRNKRAFIALTYIYGIGQSRATRILAEANVDAMKKVQDLGEDEVNRIRQVIEGEGLVEGDLRKEVSMSIKRLIEIGSYRGFRHRRNLPVRGQRTHTNARTRKGPRKGTVAQKRKATAKT
jgi:small subunit ribosomal protein S13